MFGVRMRSSQMRILQMHPPSEDDTRFLAQLARVRRMEKQSGGIDSRNADKALAEAEAAKKKRKGCKMQFAIFK